MIIDRRMTFFDDASTATKCLSFCGFMTRKRVTLGTCNESTQSLSTEACWSTDPEDLFGTCFAEVQLAGGWMQRWWHYYIVNGNGDALPAMHDVYAWGPSFEPRDFWLATAFLGPSSVHEQLAMSLRPDLPERHLPVQHSMT